jgi:manganese transport protein
MYRKILVAVDNSPADKGLLEHVTALAKSVQAELLLVHVSSGVAARYHDSLKLAESQDMKDAAAYLNQTAETVRTAGVAVTTLHARGEPPAEILKAAAQADCDLIALGGHGHRFLADLFLGSTADAVRHAARLPLLIVSRQRT